MKKIKVKTGFGYFKDKKGNIVGKAELPKGEHPLQDEFTYHEVKTKEELDAIQEYVPEKTKEDLISEIDSKLFANDIKRIRAVAENDTMYLQLYNNKAVSLRAERKALTDGGE